jgi:hypothetical protein
MGVFFAAAFGICGLRNLLPRRYAKFVPTPMGMAIPFYIGGFWWWWWWWWW